MNRFKSIKVKGVMGQYTLKEQLAEGGFAVVYSTDQDQVICKLQNLSTQASCSSFRRQKNVLVSVKHQNIVRLVDWAETDIKEGRYGVLLLENCNKGNLFRLIEGTKGELPEQAVLTIFHSVASALEAMHKYGYSHRDIKLENVLINKAGQYKLCDFGSVTEKVVTSVDKNNRLAIEQDIEKHTTPFYRSPEQLDLYSNFEIGPKVDIFALGCLIFMLCFKKQPFEMRLSAINNQYFIPEQTKYSEDLLDLIKKCFTPNPKNRPSASMLLKQLKPLLSVTASKVRRNDNKYPSNLISEIERVQNEFQHVRTTGVSGDTVKASFFGRIRKIFAQITTETEYWIADFIEENQESPPLKSTRNIIAKCWAKRYKVEKVYSIMLEAASQNINRSIVMLKMLVLLHNFLRKGPREAIVGCDNVNSQSTAVRICLQILQHWKRINANDRSEDLRRNPFISLLIQYYSLVLISKVKLCDTYACFIEGNFCPIPYFLSSAEQKILSPRFIQDLLEFLSKVADLHEKVEQFSSLPNIQRTVILSLIDEEYCLLSFLVHVYCAFKHATNYLYGHHGLDVQALRNKINAMDSQIVLLYTKLLKLIEEDSRRYASDMGGQFVRLQYQVIGHIRGIKVLELSEDKVTFNLRTHLSFETNIYGLTLPHAYEDVFKNSIEGTNNQNFSSNGDNFVDVSSFHIHKSLKKEEPTKRTPQKTVGNVSTNHSSKPNPPQTRPKLPESRSQHPSSITPQRKAPQPKHPPSQPTTQNFFGNDFFSKPASKPEPISNANFDVFMDFSHQSLNKDFSGSKIQENVVPSSNTITEYFVQNPKMQIKPATELISFDDGTQKPSRQGSPMDIKNCELIRFDDDEPDPPLLKLEEVLKPSNTSPIQLPGLLAPTSPKVQKFDVGQLTSIRFDQPANTQRSMTPRSPTSSVKGFIMEEVSRNASQFLIDFNELEFHRKVGAGTSSEVFQGSWRGQQVAIKKLKLANSNFVKEFEREVMTCVKIRPHPHIASMIGVSERTEPEEMYIVSEFCHGGTLFELLHESKVPVNWATKVSIAKQIAKGMLFLHSNQPPTIHRDLKSLNILLTDPYNNDNDRVRIKIADFGLSRELSQDFMTGSLGTYHWMAPEIFNNQAYSTKADVYSFAIVLWQIITRRVPYKNIEHTHAIMKFVTLQNGRPETTFLSSRCPKELRDLMIRCWDADPSNRPEFKQILFILGTIVIQ